MWGWGLPRLGPWWVYGVVAAIGCAAMVIYVWPVWGTIAVVLAVLVAVAALLLALRPVIRRSRLIKRGTAARATIVSVGKAGRTFWREYRRVKLTLSVEPPTGGIVYQVKTKALIDRSDVSAYRPGIRIPVLVDPRDPHVVEVE